MNETLGPIEAAEAIKEAFKTSNRISALKRGAFAPTS
jgi:hypothetical protein